MTTSYTANLKLSKPAVGDRGWGSLLNSDIDALDAVAAIGGLAVTPAEIPSATLNVRVAPGNYISSAGALVAYAGAATVATTASASTYLWLTDAGALTTGTAWPSGAYVPLAVVTSGATTITSLADARVSSRSVGPPSLAVSTVTGAYTVTPADSVLRCDATAGAFTVTLPAASTMPGRVLRLKKIDASANVITVSGSIDGGSSTTLTAQWQHLTLVADGTSNTWGVY